jgi:hypothetical protein
MAFAEITPVVSLLFIVKMKNIAIVRQGKARQGKANIFNVLIMYKENLFVGDNIIKNKYREQ